MVFGLMIKLRAKELTITTMELSTKDSGKTTSSTVMEFKSGLMAVNTKAGIKMVRSGARANTYGKTKAGMREIGLTTRFVERGDMCGLTVEDMKGNGWTT